MNCETRQTFAVVFRVLPLQMAGRRWRKRVLSVLVVGWLVSFTLSNVFVVGAEALTDRIQFDRITLDKANENKVLKVEPLDLPDRRLPSPFPSHGTIIVRLIENPEKDL